MPPKTSSSPLTVAVVGKECPCRGKRGGDGPGVDGGMMLLSGLGNCAGGCSSIRSADHGYGCVGNFLGFSTIVDGEETISGPSENPCCCLHAL